MLFYDYFCYRNFLIECWIFIVRWLISRRALIEWRSGYTAIASMLNLCTWITQWILANSTISNGHTTHIDNNHILPFIGFHNIKKKFALDVQFFFAKSVSLIFGPWLFGFMSFGRCVACNNLFISYQIFFSHFMSTNTMESNPILICWRMNFIK